MQDKKVPFWRRALQGEENLLGLLGVRLRHGVVLFLVDVARRLVLFLVDLLLFASRQRAAIGFAVAGYVLVDALLLFFAALADFVVAIVGGVGIVLVGVDLLRHLILLLVDLGFFGRRQLSAVGRAVRAGFLVDGRFLVFKVGGFSGSELAALHAVGDAVLLVLFALRDAGIRVLLGLRRRCSCWRALRGRLVLRQHRRSTRSAHEQC